MLPEIIFLMILFSITFVFAILFRSYYPFLALIFGSALILSSFISFLWAPFVPSDKNRLRSMMKLARLKKGQKAYDLGAGNGVIVHEAAKAGAVAVGYEISLPLVIQFYLRKKMGLVKGELLWGNFFKKDISDADVIFCYLLPHAMNTFYKKMYPNLKKGTRIVANAFQIKGLEPTEIDNNVYLYIKND